MPQEPQDYYVYRLVDAYGVTRYVGKGRKRRAFHHEHAARRVIANPTKSAPRIYRFMAAEIQAGREFTIHYEATELTQPQAYDIEATTIARYRRISEGGTLYNYLSGNPGWNGILHSDWCEVAARAARTAASRRTSGLGADERQPEARRQAALKAAATKSPEARRQAALKAAATRRANLAWPPYGSR
jgi:hypothetical protein